MDIEIRKKIYKFPIIYYLCQKIVDINNRIYFSQFNKKTDNLKKILNLKDSHKGERCFIVGNGPSLTMEDLELIKDEDCFASNLIFKIFDKTEWRPKYYFIQDRYADTGDILDTIDLECLFVGDYYWRKRGMKNKNAICVHSARSFNKHRVDFSNDMEKALVSHYTITYTMIQAAIYMGYKNIYLLGMDHSYALTYDSKGNVTKDESIVSHIFEDKNPKDVIANIEGMNKAYISARDYADSHGVLIMNATRGGKLEWFRRVTLEEVLQNG